MIRSVRFSNKLVWHPRYPDGSFGLEQPLYTNLDEVFDLQTTDVNGDGLTDLLLATYGSKTLYFCERNPDLTLGFPEPIITLSHGPYGVGYGDFNGDGLKDLVGLNYSGNQLFWMPFGQSGFGVDTYLISNNPEPVWSVAEDVDFDGDIDLIVGHGAGIGTWCYTNEGDGLNWTEENIMTPGSIGGPSLQVFTEDSTCTAFAIHNGDLRWARRSAGGWTGGIVFNGPVALSAFFAQQGPEGWEFRISTNGELLTITTDFDFSTAEILEDAYIGFDFRHLTMTQEGDDETLLGNRFNPNGVYALEGSEGETSAIKITSNSTSTTIPVTWVQADGDSLLEAIARNAGELVLFHYLGEESWSTETTLLNTMNVTSIDVADVDSDGDDDLLLGSSADDRIAWLECQGDGTYSSLQTIAFGDDIQSVSWHDVNGDGTLDATATNNLDGSLLLWPGSIVNGEFDFEQEVDAGFDSFGNLTHHIFFDFNQDGLSDAVVGASQRIALGIQTEDATFDWQEIGSAGTASSLRGFDVSDLTGDGYPEVFWASENWQTPTRYLNNPNGTFSSAQVEDSGPPAHWNYPEGWILSPTGDRTRVLYMSIEDLDGDGLMEVLECRSNTHTDGLFIYEQDGFGGWTDQSILHELPIQGADVTRFSVRDANLDGDGDILVAVPAWGELTFLQNLAEISGCTDSLAIQFDPQASIDNASCTYAGEECNDGLAATYNDQVDASGNCVGQSFEGENLLRINCGYTTSVVSDSEGNEWQTEQYAIGGGNTVGGGVSGTSDDHIMKYIRYATTGYDLPVPEGGNYLVRLHFAAMRNEVHTAGYEVFHVLLEGDTMESHFDIYAEAGGRQKYIFREYFIETTDDVISLRMPIVSFSNEISGIEVFQYTGDCEDLDLDDVCDDFEVFGCTESDACNYDDDATEDDGTCEFVSCAGCTDLEACNFDAEATYLDASCEYAEVGYDCTGVCLEDMDADGVCDDFEIEGCTYLGASNYMPIATDDDGSCLFDGAPAALGCTYAEACNYDPSAGFDDGSCVYPLLGRDCDGICLNDQDGDGICDEFEGCTIPTACNYNAAALDNDGCCIFAEDGADCDGNCINDIDEDGICDEAELPGCTDPLACNYSQLATDDNGTCFFAADGQDCDGNCLSDLDGDGVCDGDEVEGCADEAACNYDPAVTNPDGSCTYPDFYYDCDGNCLADADGDGVCDMLEIPGCTYAGAANFSPSATNDDGSCVFGGDAVGGCFYSSACNYDPAATVDDGSCIFPTEGLDCNGECLLDCDGDGICDANEIPGCTDAAACNYLPGATDDLDNCEYLSCAGCMDLEACNYDASAPYEDGSCEYLSCAGCTLDGACNYDAEATIEDGTCEFDSCVGCTYPEADNYDPNATIDDGSCITTGQLQAVADTAYTSGYDAGVEVTELECEEEVTDAYNEGFLQGTFFGGSGTGSGPSEEACGPGTVWNDLYQLCLPEEVCTGDISGDGQVSVQDILMLLPLFGTTCN